MGAVHKIKNLDELLGKYIGNDLKIVQVSETDLLPSDENNAGVIKVEITVNGKNGHEEKLHAVAKMLHSSHTAKKLFDVEKTVKKEISFYSTVIPKLKNFQKQSGVKDVIDFFPEYYGGRLNLNGTQVVDEDSVILIEDLLEQGYQTINPNLGCDLDEAKMVLSNLAAFHAVPLAMKFKKPMEFKRHIKANCIDTKLGNSEVTYFNPTVLLEILYENNSCLHFISKLKQKLQNGSSLTTKLDVREPFATLIHSNMWINNIMIKYEEKVPVEAKFVDFKAYVYDSPILDLMKFIITSVKLSVLKEHLDELIKHYHNNFIKHLQELDVDDKEFTWVEFINELTFVSQQTTVENLFSLMYAAFGDKSTKDNAITSKDLPLKVKDKIWYIVQEWGRKNWL